MIELRHLTSNDSLHGMFQVKEGIAYSKETGQTLTVIYPWAADYAQDKPRLPLVVFVQGSGWTTPSMSFQLPQLCELARRGYVVASVSHRSIFDGHPCPAQLVDVKCSIRYLRAHAAEYGIDPGRVAIWGSSSGAQVAQAVGVTAGLGRFQTGEWADQSDAVSCVVSCFGPCDLAAWIEFNRPNPDCEANIAALLPGDEEERAEVARAVSALTYVSPERAGSIPPYFLSVGTNDPLVELAQVTRMADALSAVGAKIDGVIVDGALHESTFWSQDVLDHIWAFIDKHLAA